MDIKELVEKAKKLRKDGELKEAEGLLRGALNGGASDWSIWAQLGHVLVAKTEYDEAVQAFREATTLNDSHFYTWLSLGYSSKEATDLEGAILATKTAMDLAETPMEHGMVLYNLACFVCLTGDNDTALDYLQQSFEKDDRIKDWAKSDSDLDELRSDSRFIEMMN
jgi:Flp pilus assembly protein TadD